VLTKHQSSHACLLPCCAVAVQICRPGRNIDDTSEMMPIDGDEHIDIDTVMMMVMIVVVMMTMMMYSSGQVSKYALPVEQRLLLQDVSASAQELVRLGGTLLHGQHRHCLA